MSSSAPIRWESLPLPVRLVMERLESKGFQIFLVGGCLRDLLRGENPQDYDLASTVPPEEMEQLLSPYPVIATGLRYGTVTAVVEGQALEITRLRREGGYKDGRRPDWVLPTEDIREDLARRDFTINAMAFSPSHGLIDPFGGAQDLEKRLIRAVGEPGRRFQEDGLRILRGLRFASRLDFDLEQETARALVEKRHLLGQVAQERITGEFIRLVEGMAAPRVLEEFFPVAVQVVPELQALQGFEQHTPYHIYDVWQHTLRVLDGVGEGREVRLAALFHDIAKPQCFFQGRRGIGHFKGHAVAGGAVTGQILKRMRFPTQLREEVCQLVRWHDEDIPQTDEAVRRWLNLLGPVQLRRLLLLQQADSRAKSPRSDTLFAGRLLQRMENILQRGDCFTLKALAVRGNDLKAMGFSGPQVGRALERLLDQVIKDPEKNQRELLLALAGGWERQ